jgi:hypothetical protein
VSPAPGGLDTHGRIAAGRRRVHPAANGSSMTFCLQVTRTFTIGAAASFGTRERSVQFVVCSRWM